MISVIRNVSILALLIGVPWFLTVSTFAQAEGPDSPVSRLLNDIKTLSSPALQGRQAGTPGGHLSADFVAERFKTLGLTSLHSPIPEIPFGEWFQRIPLRANRLRQPTHLILSTSHSARESMIQSFQIGNDYLPVLDSPSVNITAPVIFVGYGIVDPARHRDDYQSLEVQNRIVIFLRGKPSTYSRWVTHKEKAQWAKEKGAAGYLTVTGPLLNRYEARKGLGQRPLAIYAASPDYRPIPGAWMDGRSTDSILQSIGTSLETLQVSADTPVSLSSRELPLLASLQWTGQSTTGSLINVLGVIPGIHPTLKEETIILGAHRDHFGKQAGLVFSGADDNASGTAVMLETARRFIKENLRPQRTLLFVSFDGEERGLLGSQHYINNPIRPLEKTKAMINLDHIGIGNGSFTVGVTRLDKSVIKQAAQREGISERIKLYGYFPGGDHVPFYQAGVPTITIVSAGVHPHFHQATDRFDSINPEIVQAASHLVFTLAKQLANLD